MKKNLNRICAFILLVLISFSPLYMKSGGLTKENTPMKSVVANKKTLFRNYVNNLYISSTLAQYGLSADVFYKAVLGYYNLKAGNRLSDKPILSIVDFSKPSDEERLFIVDLHSHKLLYHTYVSHGKNSGDKYATRFSNAPNSLMSSLGFYVTSDIYQGKHGISLSLDGVEAGFNSNARERAVVMHSADYVCNYNAKVRGMIGKSWGCPAVPTELCIPIINQITKKTCLFLYYPDKTYEKSSRYLNEQQAFNSFFSEKMMAGKGI